MLSHHTVPYPFVLYCTLLCYTILYGIVLYSIIVTIIIITMEAALCAICTYLSPRPIFPSVLYHNILYHTILYSILLYCAEYSLSLFGRMFCITFYHIIKYCTVPYRAYSVSYICITTAGITYCMFGLYLFECAQFCPYIHTVFTKL